MYAAILIGGQFSDLSDGIVNCVAEQLQSTEILWLQHRSVGQFILSKKPDNFETLRDQMHQQGHDLNLVSYPIMRKKLLVADMDSTIIEQECIDELAAETGFGKEVVEITRLAMNGQIDFVDALKERVALLKGVSEDIIEIVWQQRIKLTPGGTELVETMKANGAKSILISGGFTAFTSRVAKTIGFEQHYANELLVHDGKLLGTVKEPALGQDAKRVILNRLLNNFDISPEDCIAVGDGANDIQMLKTAGLGVAFRAKPFVNQQIPTQIRFSDLTALLYLQGYNKENIVS